MNIDNMVIDTEGAAISVYGVIDNLGMLHRLPLGHVPASVVREIYASAAERIHGLRPDYSKKQLKAAAYHVSAAIIGEVMERCRKIRMMEIVRME